LYKRILILFYPFLTLLDLSSSSSGGGFSLSKITPSSPVEKTAFLYLAQLIVIVTLDSLEERKDEAPD
jgi:hypothetical protein